MLFTQTPVGQAPSRAAVAQASAETMWTGLLALIRALILGRRLPPDQLRMFLLFAPPVEYLSAEQIAELLGSECGHELTPELPQGWTQGPSVNDPDSGEAYNADAQIMGEMIESMLNKEHPEWKDVCWHNTYCEEGYDFISYQVLDARGRVTPIACWMEGKLGQLRNRELVPDENAKRTVICRFIERELEFLTENAGCEDETVGLDEEDQGYAAKLDAHFTGLRGDEGFYPKLERCAQHIYDSGQWYLEEWTDPWAYAPLFWAALCDLGYTEAAAHTQTKKLFAA